MSITKRSWRHRSLLPIGATALTLVAATAVAGGQSPASAATGRLVLTFADSGAQSTLSAAYAKALANVLDVNTVTYDPATYNKSGLMATSPQTFIWAGGYPQP